MKKLFSLFSILLLLPIVLASNEYGKITSGKDLLITDVDVTVDGLSSRNMEYGETISRVANPSSKIEIKIEVKNNNTVLDMTEIEMVVTIEELDLEEVVDEFDLDESEDIHKTVKFTLPSDTEEQDYEIFIEIDGELNNTIHIVEYILDLEVEEIEEEEEETTSYSYNPTKLDNISNMLDDLNTEVGSYFEPYATCVSERDSFKETIKTKDTTISGLQGYESKFITCNNNLLTCNVEREQKANANESCHYSIVPKYKQQVKDWQGYFVIGCIVTALLIYGYFWNKERKEKQGTESEEPTPPSEEEAT